MCADRAPTGSSKPTAGWGDAAIRRGAHEQTHLQSHASFLVHARLTRQYQEMSGYLDYVKPRQWDIGRIKSAAAFAAGEVGNSLGVTSSNFHIFSDVG